jgi:1-acyl-sn-glycerol-3-phosphate acyltransferase
MSGAHAYERRLAGPTSIVGKIRAQASGVICALTVFPVLGVVNGVQMASLLLRPFSRRAFRAVNRGCAGAWWGWCADVVRVFYGTRAVVSGDPLPHQESALLVANHQEMTDISFLFFLARSKGRLGDLKWFVKDVIKYVPGIGWGMLFLDCIFLKRDWASDRASIQRTFAGITGHGVPLWLVSFSEGTRITPEKAARSRAYAADAGIRATENVMIPRTKGFVGSVIGLRDHIDAIYDVTLGYPDGLCTIWQHMCGIGRIAHIHVRRHAIADLPETEAALTEWLLERFRVKDDLLTAFQQDRAFPSATGDT